MPYYNKSHHSGRTFAYLMTFVLSSKSGNKQRRHADSSLWLFLFVRPFHDACVSSQEHVPPPTHMCLLKLPSFLPSVLSYPICCSHHHYNLLLIIRALTSISFQNMSIQFYPIYLPDTCLATLPTFHSLFLPCLSSQILPSDYQVCPKPRLNDTAPNADVTHSITMAVRRSKEPPQNVHRCRLPQRHTRSRNLGATAKFQKPEE